MTTLSAAAADRVFGFLGRPKRWILPNTAAWMPLEPMVALVRDGADGLSFREAVLEADASIDAHSFDAAIDELAPIELGHVYSSFSLMTQKYIFGVQDDLKETLPRVLGIPYKRLSERHGAAMTLTYDALVLNNWCLVDPTKPPSLANIDVVVSVVGTEAERGFARVHMAIEAAGGDLPARMLELDDMLAASKDPSGDLQAILVDARDRVHKMGDLVGAMYSQCSEADFWFTVRLTLMGSPEERFPDGIRVEGTDIVMERKGGSGAQSPVMHALDKFFGIFHVGNGRNDDHRHERVLKLLDQPPVHAREFIEEQSRFMAHGHRAFQKQLELSPTARDYVLRYASPECVDEYNRCIDELVRFRRIHQRMAHTYISTKVSRGIKGGGTNVVGATKGSQYSDFGAMLPQLAAETAASKMDAIPKPASSGVAAAGEEDEE